jgi:toxin ParE1/3/4
MLVVWTLEALDRLIEIEDYIARDNPGRATRFIELLIGRGFSLTNNPLRGRIVPEFSDPRIRELLIRDYRLVYRSAPNRIEILTVFEGHRQFRTDDLKP